MHEYLIYYSPTRNKYVKLGANYGSLIMYNDIRDYSWNYSQNNQKIGSFTKNAIYTKTLTIKWVNDPSFTRYKKFIELTTADVLAGVKGRLYLPGNFYLLCNIVAGSQSEYLVKDDFIQCTYKVLTDRNEFRVDWSLYHSFPTSDPDWYTRDILTEEGYCGADIFIKMEKSASSVKGALNVTWNNDQYAEDIIRYGLSDESVSYDEIRINSYKRTITGLLGNNQINLFNKRIKDDHGAFYEPNKSFASISLVPDYKGIDVSMALSIKYISPSVSWGHAPFDMVPQLIDFETGDLIPVPEDE